MRRVGGKEQRLRYRAECWSDTRNFCAVKIQSHTTKRSSTQAKGSSGSENAERRLLRSRFFAVRKGALRVSPNRHSTIVINILESADSLLDALQRIEGVDHIGAGPPCQWFWNTITGPIFLQADL